MPRNTLWEPVWQLTFYSLEQLRQAKVAGWLKRAYMRKKDSKIFIFVVKKFLCSSLKCVYFETKCNWLNWCIICHVLWNSEYYNKLELGLCALKIMKGDFKRWILEDVESSDFSIVGSTVPAFFLYGLKKITNSWSQNRQYWYLVWNMCTRMKAALTSLLYTMQLVSNSVQKKCSF